MPAIGGNLAQGMDPIPLPQAQPVQVRTAEDVGLQQPPAEPASYHGGKTGAVADIADKFLTGWMAGKKISEDKQRQKAADSIGAAKQAFNVVGANYKAAVESKDPAKIADAYKALSVSWKNYVNMAEKYVSPPDTGKKSGVKDKLKKAFLPNSPELYQQTTLDILKNTDPASMFAPSKAEQQQSDLTDMQLKDLKNKQDAKDRYEHVAQVDTQKRTPEDEKFLEFYEYENFGKTAADRKKDDLLNLAMDGKLPPSGPQHDLAVQMGIVRPDVASTQIRQVMGPKGQPQSQLISIGPDGKVVGTSTLPGNDYIPPNQAQIAGQVIQSQVAALANIAKKAHPEWDEPTRMQFALSEIGRSSGGSTDWFMKNQQMDVMNRAINAVLQKHSHYSANGGGRTFDDIGNVISSDFVTATPDGRYVWNASLGKPESHWIGADTYNGKTKEELQGYDNNVRAELRAELKKQNPKLADKDIDAMMPQSVFGGGGDKGMTKPPATTGMDAAPNAPQGEGQQMYSVVLGDGTRAKRAMSKEYADALRAKGVGVTLIGGSTDDQIPGNLP